MDIKYEIEPIFKIEFFTIKCINFKNKKKKLEKVLERYPEMPQANFSSNRNKCSINTEFREIFKRGEANFLRHGSYTLALAFFQHSSGHLKAYFFQVYVG